MDALVAVDQLSDTQIGGERAERVGVLRAQAGMLADERDHVAQRLLRRVIKVFVETHGDPAIRLFRARIFELHVLPQVKLESAGQRSFDRGKANLAVTLQGMAVAGREQRAGDEDGKISNAADAE